MIRQFYVGGEEVKRSMDWLIKRLVKEGPGLLTTPGDGLSMRPRLFCCRAITALDWSGALKFHRI
jgi:hypothetical protein